MDNSPIYLSAPSVSFAENQFTNEQIIEKVYRNFIGTKEEWKKIKTGISYVFKYCNTKNRFLGLREGYSPVDYAVDVAKDVCTQNRVDISNIDLVIYGGVYRDYFEPATAMEIASKIGLQEVSAFDTTNACAGLMQALQIGRALMLSDIKIRNVLCCSTDFPDEAINYDIQSFEELAKKSAGLTLGGGASAWLLSREPIGIGGVKLLSIRNTSFPTSYDVCKVPVTNRKFDSLSTEIFSLGIKHVPVEITRITEEIGWNIDDIDCVLAHQPSRKIIHDICNITGIPYEKAPLIHSQYGNTINSSIPMTMDFALNERGFNSGDKIIFNSAAAGFSMVTAAGIWVENLKPA